MQTPLALVLTLSGLVCATPGCKKKSETESAPITAPAPSAIAKQCQAMLSEQAGRAVIEVLLQEKGVPQPAELDGPAILAQCQSIPPKVLSCYRNMDLGEPHL